MGRLLRLLRRGQTDLIVRLGVCDLLAALAAAGKRDRTVAATLHSPECHGGADGLVAVVCALHCRRAAGGLQASAQVVVLALLDLPPPPPPDDDTPLLTNGHHPSPETEDAAGSALRRCILRTIGEGEVARLEALLRQPEVLVLDDAT